MARPDWQLLPDPEPQERTYSVISVDDHLTEPADVFTERVPAKLREQAPQVITLPDGSERWAYQGKLFYDLGLSVVSGRPRAEWKSESLNFDEMRRACWDVHARVEDMDLDGIWASLCYPSGAWGFVGRNLSLGKDREVAIASVRAWNSWLIEEWVGAYPERFIPMQLMYLRDPEVAAGDIRRNAELGFKAVSFLESPHLLGLPSIFDHDHWRPFFEACQDTDTVICLHAGASGFVLQGSPGAGLNAQVSMFPAGAYCAAMDWIWSEIPVMYPNLKFALAEGGIGWVPMAIDRLDYVTEHSAGSASSEPWNHDLTPSEVLLRNFYFCMLDDPSVLANRHQIGIDHIMFEVDYPHADSTWPNTQELLRRRFADLPREEAVAIAGGSAAKLFGHPLPQADAWPEITIPGHTTRAA